MNIIISPAKKMNPVPDLGISTGFPVFLEDTKTIHKAISCLTKEDLKQLFCANDAITELNYQRYREMDLERSLTPAVLAYVGLQYQAMAPMVFSDRQWAYAKRHLKILSGFYGLLGACDGVVPYRLEMQAKLSVEGGKSLYEFWGGRIYKELVKTDKVILNLASKEYSQVVKPYLEPDVTFVTCVFGEWIQGRVKVKATKAKMARGSMVRWLSEHDIQRIEDIREFREMGFRYVKEYSSDTEYVFIQTDMGDGEMEKQI